jgi:hypothetical protein
VCIERSRIPSSEKTLRPVSASQCAFVIAVCDGWPDCSNENDTGLLVAADSTLNAETRSTIRRQLSPGN